nr:NAC transcription factor 56-like [Setaria viridis]
MEASRFGFDFPPAYKFDPTDADIVAHYLLPRAIGFPNPYAHAIIDDDPYSCPPWEFMRRHGHAGSDHAFFFGPQREPDPRKKAARTVAPGEDGVGGTWDGQRSDATRLVLLRAGAGAEGPRLEVTYKRHNLSYYHGPQKKKTSGWVMHEYQIIDPPHLAGTILSRVKITGKEKKNEGKQQKQADAGQQVVPPGPDQAGPSNYYHQPVGGGEEYGGAMGDNTGVCYVGDGNDYYMYEGDGSGGGDCFPAGDGGSYADDGNNYSNQDSGYCGYPDGGGGFFHVGDNNSYEYPDGGREEGQCTV